MGVAHRAALALALALALATGGALVAMAPARADTAARGGAGAVRPGLGQVHVDWARGQVTARGIGLADRLAPSPAVARGPARRKAEDAARQTLAAALPTLPLATGGTVADKLGDPQVAARLAQAVAAARTLEAEPETDGSWRVVMAVPIEAVRQAVVGPRALPAAPGDDAIPVVIVEAPRATPAVGATIGGIAAPTLWVAAAPAWTKGAPRVEATPGPAGALEVKAPRGGEATLFVIVTR